jgi:hypothetical protein
VREAARSFGQELSYIVISKTVAAAPANRGQARQLLESLIADLKTQGAREGKGAFLPTLEQFLTDRGRLSSSSLQRALFGLMFYLWVVDDLPNARAPEYWAGKAQLYEAFVTFLYSEMLNIHPVLPFDAVCDLVGEEDARFNDASSVSNFLQSIFKRAFIGTAAAIDIVPDVFLVEANLPGLHSGRDIVIAWFLIVAGVFSGPTELALLALAIDVAIGVCQFLFDIHVMERDGEITEKEQDQAAWSFGFIFVPLLPFGLDHLKLQKLAALLITLPLPVLLFEFFRFLKECLEEMIEYQKRLRLARAAGFESYGELDVDSTIVIPLTALASSESGS